MRRALLDGLRAGAPWELLIIGGGATGLGAAVDAAARGYRVALVEARDFAQGTSSRSTKLIHGGVRYLASGQIGLVREALAERGRLLRNAPHLVHALDFAVPSYSRWSRPYYGLGLTLYDMLSGRYRLGRSRLVSRAELLDLAPTLRRPGLRGGVIYRDGQFNDSRLAITLARTAADLGALVLNYCPVVSVRKQYGRVSGVVVRDAETGTEITVHARAVLNATGVFADEVRALDEPQAVRVIRPSRGIHLVFGAELLPGRTGVLVPRTDDGRVLFAIPWRGRVLLGTTDTPVEHVDIEPRADRGEIAYLLEHAARYLDPAPRESEIRGIFAGLRPLVDSRHAGTTASLSREHAVFVSDSGLVTITGGKWTTYRRMAADAIDRAARVADLPKRPCVTESLRLHGWTESPTSSPQGADEPAVRQLRDEYPGGNEQLDPRLNDRVGDVVWSARHEWARSVEDILSRRCRALLLDAAAAIAAAPRVAAILAVELGHDEAWQRSQVEAFQRLARNYLPCAEGC